MAIESDADRALFLDADEFGVSVTYRKKGTFTDLTLAAIFDAEHSLAGFGDGSDVASVAPQVLMRTADLPSGHGDGDSVTIAGTAYLVRYREPDGTGMTVLKLEKA